jgi:hypothetical protein
MIAKDLFIMKDRCSYTIRILRQEKILHDHGNLAGRQKLPDITRERHCIMSSLAKPHCPQEG